MIPADADTRPFLRWEEAAVAVAIGLVAALLVHAWGGDELIRCEDGRTTCAVGSGASWTWTGAMSFAPTLALLGFGWSRHLHRTERLGPFAPALVPDWEEQLEVVAVLAAALISFLLIRNGPKVQIVDATWFNDWLAGHLGTDQGTDLVPSRPTWFLVGVIMSAPFAFAAGSAVGREWYRWRRRRADAVHSRMRG